MKRYTLAYNFLPQLVSLCNKQILDPSSLVDLNLWKEFSDEYYQHDADGNNVADEFSWDEIEIDFKPTSKDQAIITIVFPIPQEEPEALFGCIVIDKPNKDFTFYTLEMGQNGHWFIGAMDDEKHLNYGIMDDAPEMNAFVEHVLAL